MFLYDFDPWPYVMQKRLAFGWAGHVFEPPGPLATSGALAFALIAPF